MLALHPLNYVAISNLGFFLSSDLEEQFGYMSPFFWLPVIKSLTWIHMNFSILKGTCTIARQCVLLKRKNQFPFQRDKYFKTNLEIIMPHVLFVLPGTTQYGSCEERSKEKPSAIRKRVIREFTRNIHYHLWNVHLKYQEI